jgi:HD-GYP domain-containing protein (c-di-GMP phosphodiesterase class II)
MVKKSKEKLDSAEKPTFLAGTWKITATSASRDSGDFIPLPVQNLIAGQQIPFEVFIRTSAAGEDKDQFKSCCPTGQVFEPSWLEKLQEVGVSRIYFHRQDEPKVLNYLTRALPIILADTSMPLKEKADRLLDVTYLWAQQFFGNTETITGPQLKQGFQYMGLLFKSLPQDHYHRSWLLDLCRRDQTLYAHCLNTSLLGMAFAKYLGWGDKKIQEVGRAAMLHDIGMTRVPASILRKNGALSEAEMELVKKHPRDGFLMLKTLAPMSREGLLLVLQHHENGDGSGYPEGLTLTQIHTLAKLMHIIDSFETLISSRSRPKASPTEALWIMRQDWQQSGIYDAGLLAEFIKFMGADDK